MILSGNKEQCSIDLKIIKGLATVNQNEHEKSDKNDGCATEHMLKRFFDVNEPTEKKCMIRVLSAKITINDVVVADDQCANDTMTHMKLTLK